MWYTEKNRPVPPTVAGKARDAALRTVQVVLQVPLWVWALVLAGLSLAGALTWVAQLDDWWRPCLPRKLLAYSSILAIVLGLVGAARDADQWRGGVTAAVIGAIGMVAWAVARALAGAMGV